MRGEEVGSRTPLVSLTAFLRLGPAIGNVEFDKAAVVTAPSMNFVLVAPIRPDAEQPPPARRAGAPAGDERPKGAK